MKLNYKNKIEIYKLKKSGMTWSKLSRKFNVNVSNLKYLVKLIDKYGIESVKKGKNIHYSIETKKEIIEEVIIKGRAQLQVSLDYALPNKGTLPNWIAHYKKNGYTIVEKQRGRPSIMGRKKKKTWEEMTELEKLKEENERLRTEVAYLKKLRELRLKDEAEEERQKLLKKCLLEDLD